jgi:hypothetical protein
MRRIILAERVVIRLTILRSSQVKPEDDWSLSPEGHASLNVPDSNVHA